MVLGYLVRSLSVAVGSLRPQLKPRSAAVGVFVTDVPCFAEAKDTTAASAGFDWTLARNAYCRLDFGGGGLPLTSRWMLGRPVGGCGTFRVDFCLAAELTHRMYPLQYRSVGEHQCWFVSIEWVVHKMVTKRISRR